MKNNIWQPTKTPGLRRYRPSGMYYLHKKFAGRVVDESLETADLPGAKVRFSDRVAELTRTPPQADPLTKSSKLCFRDLIVIYLERLKAGAFGDLDAKTLDKRDYLLRSIKSSWRTVPGFIRNKTTDLESLSPGDVSYDDLLAWRKHFLGVPADHEEYDEESEPGLGYSPDYFNKALKIIQDLFELASERRQVRENPALRIKPAPVQRETYILPTPAEFAQILAYNNEGYHNGLSQHCRDLVEGISWTGLRLSEARALCREFVDLKNWEIRLPARVCKGVRGKKLGRTIDILPEARALIERLHRDAGTDGKLFKVSEATQWLEQACKKVNWPHKFTHHSLRHYYATRCMEATNSDVLTVAGWLGHRDNGKLLLSTYAHLCRRHSKATAESIRFYPGNIIALPGAEPASVPAEQDKNAC